MFSFNSIRMIESFGSIGGKQNALFGYATNDTKNAVEGAGYFNAFAKNCQTGDIIVVSGDLDGTPWHSSYTVGSDGSTVTLTEHAGVTQNVIQEVYLGAMSSKASDAAELRYVPSFAGTLDKIYTVLNAALATGDATFTAAINGTPVTSGVVTAAESGSAAGDVDVATPSAANAFEAGDVITITGGGASTATATASVTLKMTPT